MVGDDSSTNARFALLFGLLEMEAAPGVPGAAVIWVFFWPAAFGLRPGFDASLLLLRWAYVLGEADVVYVAQHGGSRR
jgi:hypothetical protein